MEEPDEVERAERGLPNTSPAGFRLFALHVFAGVALFVAHPVLYLVGERAVFFVARGSGSGEVLSAAAVFCLALPAAIVLLAGAAWLLGRRAALASTGVVVFALTSLGALQLVKSANLAPAALAVVAGGLAATATFAYLRRPLVRSFASALSVAIVLVPGWFLFGAPVSSLVFPSATKLHAVEPKGETPVVILILDELPLLTLLDERGEIHAERFPHFATLAARSTWYRNATGASDWTLVAVPAILSGVRPASETAGALPTHGAYPDNLFTLLGGSYTLRVDELSTALCPDDLGTRTHSSTQRVKRSLFSDLCTLYAHAILPRAIADEHLPRIDTAWGGFQGQRGLPDWAIGWRQDTGQATDQAVGLIKRRWTVTNQADRLARFREFVAAIEPTPKRALYFHHALFPHQPYGYLPTGQRYQYVTWDTGDPRDHKFRDEWHASRTYVRMLLQTAFVDRLVGELIARLDAQGLWDDALVIVTSDHGVGVRTGYRRPISARNLTDVAAVPLFVKLPGQTQGSVSERPVECLDVLPTVADVLGVTIPWPVDGQSLATPSAQPRERSIFCGQWSFGRDDVEGVVPNSAVVLTDHLAALEGALAEQTAQLDDRRPDFGALYGAGPFRSLLGRPLDELSAPVASSFRAAIVDPKRYQAVDLDAEFLPCYVAVRMGDVPRDAKLGAIVLNGAVRALFQLPPRGQENAFAMLPYDALRAGANDVRILLLAGTPDAPVLLASD